MKWISAQPLIGGMSYGFEKEFGMPECIVTGFAINDKQYINYTNVQRKLNIPVVTMNPEYNEILEDSECKEIPQDCLWVMVPICSGLSMLNSSTEGDSARGDPDNKQNQNMYNLTSLAMRNNASAIVFENAPALYTNSGKGVSDRLYEIAKEHGYSMGVIKTSTIYHGIPQNRERTFAMFYRDSNPPLFEFEHKPLQNYIEYLDMIPKDATLQDEYFIDEDLNDNIYIKIICKVLNKKNFNEVNEYFKNEEYSHVSFFHMLRHCGFEECLKVIDDKLKELENSEDFETSEDKQYEHKQYSKLKTRIFYVLDKLNDNKGYFDTTPVLYYIDYVNAVISKNLALINPKYGRYMNIRELLSLMGMPYDFQFSEDGTWYMLTQNVPVCTANYIARQIYKYFNNELKIADVDFVRQNNISWSNDFENIITVEEW